MDRRGIGQLKVEIDATNASSQLDFGIFYVSVASRIKCL